VSHMVKYVSFLTNFQIGTFVSLNSYILMIQICVFCFPFRDADWDGAFNFTKDLTFLTMCAQEMKGT
jgi:hypothetical protein